MRVDFLTLSPAEGRGQRTEDRGQRTEGRGHDAQGSAYIPFSYISDARQRIEIYRRLAQATEKSTLTELEKELRDRFGPLPSALGLLFQLTEIKILAGERGISSIEVKEDKLMLTRNNDLIMVGNKFPRLTKKQGSARLNEIKKLLLSL